MVSSYSNWRNGVAEIELKERKVGGGFSFCASDIRFSLALNIFIPCSDATLIPPSCGIIDLACIFSVHPSLGRPGEALNVLKSSVL